MSAYLLAGLIGTGAWTQLDEIGWGAPALLMLAFAFDRWRPAIAVGSRARVPTPLFPEGFTSRALLIGAGISLPVLTHVGLTLREEFGFGGDEGYHLSATRAFALYLRAAGPLLGTVLVACAIVARFHRRYLGTLAIAALAAASYWLEPHTIFGRYPTGFYLLSTPLNVGFDVAGFPYPFVANHIVNVVSVPVWLFVLRPILLRRWPDVVMLPVALLLYCQPLAIVYAGGGMLEPWAVIFLLLAIEGLTVWPAGDRWMAVLLAGAATCFKETAVLLLPAVWLLAMVEWHGWRPVLRRGAVTVGAAAAAPFVVYYLVRRKLAIERQYLVADPVTLWAPARAIEWIGNVHYQLGSGGAIVIGALAAWVVCGLWILRREPDRWRQHALWAATSMALVVFFYVDSASVPFTGYGRFLLYSLLALAGILFVATDCLASSHRRVLIAVSAAIFVLQLLPTARMLALDLAPGYGRNSLEWAHSLVRLPIRALAGQIHSQPGGASVRRIRLVSFGIDMISVKVAYPDLAERYEMAPNYQNPASPDCGCRDDAEAVLAGFELPANFSRHRLAGDVFEKGEAACVRQVQTTCERAVVERHADGRVVGVLGIDAR